MLFNGIWTSISLHKVYTGLGSFAEEDIGRQSITVPSAAGNATASRGLEVAVANLQDYCNGMLPLPFGRITNTEFINFLYAIQLHYSKIERVI